MRASPSQALTPAKRRLFGVLSMLLGLSLAFGAAEVVLFFKGRPTGDIYAVRTRDGETHHALVPMSEGTLRWGYRSNRYFINSLGFRDASKRVVERESEVGKRILLLGDSFTEGMGVEHERSVAGVLERLHREAGHPVEVLNAGVASYSPFIEYRVLKRFFARGYTTDQVIVLLDISDIQDEAIAPYHSMAEEQLFYSRFSVLASRVFRSSSLAYTFWETFVFKDLEQRTKYYEARGRWTEDDRLYEEFGKRGIERCQANILRIRELAAAHGASFRLVIYPWLAQLKSERIPSLQETEFGRFAREKRIPFTNLFPAFRKAAEPLQLFIPGDAHWNENGHLLVASRILEDLVKEIETVATEVSLP